MGGLRTEVCGQQKQSTDPRNNQHNLNTPTTGRCYRANGTPCPIQHSPSTLTTGLCRSTARSDRMQQLTERSDPTQHTKR